MSWLEWHGISWWLTTAEAGWSPGRNLISYIINDGKKSSPNADIFLVSSFFNLKCVSPLWHNGSEIPEARMGEPQSSIPCSRGTTLQSSFLPLSNRSAECSPLPQRTTNLYSGASSFPKIKFMGLFLLFPRGEAKTQQKRLYKIYRNIAGNHLPFWKPLGQRGVAIIWNL